MQIAKKNILLYSNLSLMRLIRHPWIWFLRFRHRCGYGVHSPFAFGFINDVVYEQTAYYAYRELAQLHPWWVRWFRLYPLTCQRLLFRLANYVHPKTILLIGDRPIERQYLSAAVPSARWIQEQDAKGNAPDLVFIAHDQLAKTTDFIGRMPPTGAMALEGIHEDNEALQLWRHLQADSHTGITFDLYTYGILFFNPQLNKQHYIVNF